MSSKSNSKFLGQVLVLLKGNTVAQIIPVIITPIITRLYSIESIGALAVFVSLSSIIAALSPAGLEQAVVLAHSNRRANRVILIAGMSVLIFSLLSLIIITIVKLAVPDNRLLIELNKFIWMIPIASALMASTNIINQYHLRYSELKKISNGVILKFTSLGVIQIGLGLLAKVESGLVWGRISSNIAQFLFVARNLNVKNFRSSRNEMVATLKRYKKFPIFTVWGTFANISAIYIVSVLIANYYSIKEAGEFALMQRVLVIPIFFIGQAFGQIYYKHIVAERHKTGFGLKSYRNAIALLSISGVVIFVPLYFFGIDFIDVFLGGKVEDISTYVKILAPMFFIRYIANPLSMTLNAFERQELNMIWQVTLFASIVAVFLVSNLLNYDLTQLLRIYSVVVSIMYTIQIVLSFKIACTPPSSQSTVLS
ncbi:MAG: oligosaccharide flippase family protein [Candidatus Marinimicrobia bacterium]|nr:oligosaccharide flippase family protein [Candidatus Neomarinimicrobiota bacterium]MBT4362756.1 oligosaccharide flippase family protein [Candidatus Neomarinimicrobiota bacterium]MBT4715246.1 oligosaccharide flippase family protein [Candidatus Neomarinimicrobiota bacterium]MBT4947415.1 oligosaccharide flippase family protein [Candidatus Neomarinimicrobiota bacterium]MBT5267868.1 oligosaccharide flippase family protein [Candidatus Neomarinimicrobiota bacterium]